LAVVIVSSWGRLEPRKHEVRILSDRHQVVEQLKNSRSGIAYGMGRSYGDVCLNPNGILWKTSGLDRFINLDETSGKLECESGILIRDIQRFLIPRGWSLPVTPGTQLVTVGGAIANDVHGKNHHVFGSFGNHVKKIKLCRTDGAAIECDPHLLPDWFSATIGGLGLTGVITEAVIQLRRVNGPWLDTETIPYANLEEFFHLADASEAHWEHTVSWIDCISNNKGRGLFMRGNPSDENNRRPALQNRALTMPFVPFSLINAPSLRVFNALYFNLKKRKNGKSICHYGPFFYPLDNLLEWNRIYGPRGFFQYQCVVPRQVGGDAIREMLKETARSGDGSFLATLKTFGNRQSVGMLSFPQPGATLALDFPNKEQHSLKLFERLDAIVREAGGRLYLAKDARMSRSLFEAGYPRFAEFLQYRDPKISSALSRRLMGY
jgi:FAD/FMN-containing dehydrogenase